MWTILATLSSECDEKVVAETAAVPICTSADNYNFWSPARLSLDGFDLGYNHLILKFVLQCNQGRIQVHSVSIPTDQLRHHHQVLPEKKASLRRRGFLVESLERISTVNHVLKITSPGGIPVEFSYVSYRYFDLGDSTTPLGQIHINSLAVQVDLAPYLVKAGHKITALLNDVYLGRAQTCFTQDTNRFLTWTSSPGDWMSPRHASDFNRVLEEKSDLDLIRLADPAGFGRVKNVKLQEHVPDNDAFKNTIPKLPAYFTSVDKPMRIKIFNFKFTPPRCVETVVKWSDFEHGTCLIQSPRNITPRSLFRRKTPAISPRMEQMGTVERELVSGMRFRLSYCLIDDSKARISSMTLHTKDFEKTFDMEQIQTPKTV